MRFRLTATLGVSCLALLAAAPALADTTAASKIDTVTVYPDAASVTRIAEVDLPKGTSTVLFKGLPIGVDAASLRLAGEASFGLTIASVESRVVPAEQAAPDNQLAEKLKQLRGARDELQVRLDALERRKAMIVRFSQAGPEKLSPDSKPLDIDKWSSAWDAVGNAMTKVGNELREASGKARDLDAEIRNLGEAQTQPSGARGPVRDVAVIVDADAAGRAHLALTYRISGAGWHPQYDARLQTGGDAAKPELELVRRAAITQRTGEDWRDVALSVSTVRTDRGTAAPTVQPLQASYSEPEEVFLDAAPRGEARRSRMLKKAMPAPPPAMAAPPAPGAPAAKSEPAREAKASLDAGAYQASFTIGGRISVPADGAEKSFRLDARTIEPTIELATAPALDPTAYLDAKFVNTDEAPLLPGDVALVRDGTFVGTGSLGLVPPGEKVDLGFGADDRVKITRVPVGRKENDPVWIGSNKVAISEYKTTVKNLHGFPVKVSVVDQIPFSEITTLVVEKLPATTAPTGKMVGDKRGVIGWTFDLAPDATKELHIAWRMRWPADSAVVLTNAP